MRSLLKRWEQLPQELQNDSVRPYYEALSRKRGQLLLKRVFDILLSLVLLVLLSSLLAACVTAFAGPISFVGIAVPHLVKQALGSAKPLHVLPGCALGGAAFCLLCDLIARSLFAPTELSISAVTAVFGAPVVIWLLVRRQTQEGRE